MLALHCSTSTLLAGACACPSPWCTCCLQSGQYRCDTAMPQMAQHLCTAPQHHAQRSSCSLLAPALAQTELRRCPCCSLSARAPTFNLVHSTPNTPRLYRRCHISSHQPPMGGQDAPTDPAHGQPSRRPGDLPWHHALHVQHCPSGGRWRTLEVTGSQDLLSSLLHALLGHKTWGPPCWLVRIGACPRVCNQQAAWAGCHALWHLLDLLQRSSAVAFTTQHAHRYDVGRAVHQPLSTHLISLDQP